MTEDASGHRNKLIAAALAGGLTVWEQREFDLACSADPEMLEEYRALQEISDRLEQSNLSWADPELPPGLAARVFAATSAESVATVPTSTLHARRRPDPAGVNRRGARPRMAFLGLAAAGLLVLGGLGGAAVSNLVQSPQEGPPGALGAVEEVRFPVVPEGTSFDAALIAHT